MQLHVHLDIKPLGRFTPSATGGSMRPLQM